MFFFVFFLLVKHLFVCTYLEKGLFHLPLSAIALFDKDNKLPQTNIKACLSFSQAVLLDKNAQMERQILSRWIGCGVFSSVRVCLAPSPDAKLLFLSANILRRCVVIIVKLRGSPYQIPLRLLMAEESVRFIRLDGLLKLWRRYITPFAAVKPAIGVDRLNCTAAVSSVIWRTHLNSSLFFWDVYAALSPPLHHTYCTHLWSQSHSVMKNNSRARG